MKNLPLDPAKDSLRVVIDTQVVDPATVDDDGVRFCLDFWTSCRGTAFAPRWADFHLDQLPPRLLPYVLVLDVEYDPVSYIYRFWGTGHSRYHQQDYTGRKITDMSLSWSSRLLLEQYAQVLNARKPLVFINTYEGVEVPLKSLRMPLSDDGTTITHMFSYVGRGSVNEDMKRLFDKG